MKKQILLLLCIGLLAAACSKDEFRSEWNDSYDKFKAFERSNSKNYSYAVEFGSWTGYSTRTVIFVQDGRVTSRVFNSYMINKAGKPEPKEAWSENLNTLNSHNIGAPTITLDEIYQQAKNEWLKVNKDENEIYFETNNQGMISMAGYRPKNCQDDCFHGVHLKEISPFITTTLPGK